MARFALLRSLVDNFAVNARKFRRSSSDISHRYRCTLYNFIFTWTLFGNYWKKISHKESGLPVYPLLSTEVTAVISEFNISVASGIPNPLATLWRRNQGDWRFFCQQRQCIFGPSTTTIELRCGSIEDQQATRPAGQSVVAPRISRFDGFLRYSP